MAERRGTGVLLVATAVAAGGLAVLVLGYGLARDWLLINPEIVSVEWGVRPRLASALVRALGFRPDHDVLELLVAALGACGVAFALGVWTGWVARRR